MAALRRANAIRSYRKNLKTEMKFYRRDPREIVLDPDPKVASARVGEFLQWCPKVGKVKVSRTLHKVRISPSKTLGGMTKRQRRELVAEMDSFPGILELQH